MTVAFRSAPVVWLLSCALLALGQSQQLVLSLDAGGGNDRPGNVIGSSKTFGTVISIAGTDQNALYSKHRYGMDFSYVFSLPKNVAYDITFYITESYNGNCVTGNRVFSIYAYDDALGVSSGKSLENVDVFSMVGCRVAYQYEMNSVSLTTGNLRLQFVSSVENAMISGFDITTTDTTFSASPSPSKQVFTSTDMVDINCGNDPNDQNLPNTKIGSAPNSATVIGTANAPAEYYRKTRAGPDFTYKFFLSPGTYDVILGFGETYIKYCNPGWRVFNVFVNGALFLDKYDVFVKSGGCYTGVEERLSGQVVDGSGPLTIRFDSITRNAAVAFIGIVPVGVGPPPSMSPVSSPMSSADPSSVPSAVPSTVPSALPSTVPSAMPSSDPSVNPTPSPSAVQSTPTANSVTIDVGSSGDMAVAGTAKYSSASTFTATSNIGANAFKTGRSGTDFSYTFNFAPGAYDILIGFAEYQNSFCTEPGQRVFNVFVNDEIQVESIDLSTSGCFTGVQEIISSSVGVVDTQPITIRFEAIIGEAIVSYIKISPAADVCIPASNSGGLEPGEDHAAHSVPGSYPPQLSASSPKSYVDSNGDGFAAVFIDGSGSHSHFFDAANNIIGVITEYKWSLVETGEVLSTKEKFWYSFPLGTTRLKLSVLDNSCTTDEAETTVTVTGAMQPGQYCYYYSGAGDMVIGGEPVAQAPYPKFASISTSLNLGFPSFYFDNTLFIARCFFFLEVDNDSEVTVIGATTGGTGDVRIYKGTDLLVDTKAADSMETTLSVGLSSFEVIYERTSTSGTPQLQFKVNNTIPASGKVFHDRTTVVPILSTLTPAEGADGGGTSVKVTGYGLYQPLTIDFGGIAVTPTSGNPSQFFVSSPPGTGTASITATTSAELTSNALIFSYGSSCDSVSFLETAIKKANGADVNYLSLPTCATLGGDGKIYMGTLGASVQVLGYDHETLTVTSHCYSKNLVDNNFKKNGVPSQRDALGIAFDPRDTSLSPYISTSTLFWFDKGRVDTSNKAAWRNGAIDRLKPGADATDSKVCLVYDKRVVSGLPISNHDHGANALVFTQNGDLMIGVGGFTNMGLPGYKLGNYWETTLSAAILKVQLSKGAAFDGNIQYSNEDTPRLSEKISGDVEVYAPGLRNVFGMCLMSTGDMYAADQGPNCNFGNSATDCSDYDAAAAAAYDPFEKVDWPGLTAHGWQSCPYSITRPDKILHITPGSYYGHPNLARGGDECSWIDPFDDKTNDNKPPPASYKEEMVTIKSPVTGIKEYRSNHFCGKLRNELILSSHNGGKTYRMGVSGATVTSGPDQISSTGGITFVEDAHGNLIFPRLTAQKVFVMQPKLAPKAALYVSNAMPWRHGKAGGTKVLIGGKNFGASPVVTIDGSPCAVVASSETQITCTVPPSGSGGLKDLAVAANGVSVTLPDAIMYMTV
ncbi:unnamed protein product [Agarophyton chilense]|eukprot:gb/GEZJ01002954.1/.p1 GENE.gb/GEZJ01002954.1/~~gb/GEZJ01002954.1/.p1  ORF type:complete len:1430 (-),score=191.35 gb/GEZJ01002954.1/:680-4969(-)